MNEKLFVIMEVEKSGFKPRDYLVAYRPVDSMEPNIETLWLKPKRIISASRLKYDVPKFGEVFFNPNLGGWVLASHNDRRLRYLVRKSPKTESISESEKDDFEKWVQEMPRHTNFLIGGSTINDFDMGAWEDAMRVWLKRMPREK